MHDKNTALVDIRSILLKSLRRECFIVSPLFDSIFFIGSPLVALGVIFFLLQFMQPRTLENHTLMFMAIGHHVPTFLRAYGDPDEFSQNQFRLMVIPLAIFGVIVTSSLLLSQILTFLLIWDQYHFVRQHYGFMRIYDVKNKSIPKGGVNLDLWLCFSTYFAIIAYSDFYSYIYQRTFLNVGILFPPGVGTVLARGSLILALGVGGFFLVDLVKRLSRGESVCLLKYLIFITTYGVWYYSYVILSHPYLSYSITSFFHCFQYDALAWYYNHTKAEAIGNTRNIKIFRYIHSVKNLWAYFLSIFSYSIFSLFLQGSAPGFIIIINRTTGFLHYYFDSFIWRVRKTDFRKYL